MTASSASSLFIPLLDQTRALAQRKRHEKTLLTLLTLCEAILFGASARRGARLKADRSHDAQQDGQLRSVH